MQFKGACLPSLPLMGEFDKFAKYMLFWDTEPNLFLLSGKVQLFNRYFTCDLTPDLSANNDGVLASTACRHFGSPSCEITMFCS